MSFSSSSTLSISSIKSRSDLRNEAKGYFEAASSYGVGDGSGMGWSIQRGGAVRDNRRGKRWYPYVWPVSVSRVITKNARHKPAENRALSFQEFWP